MSSDHEDAAFERYQSLRTEAEKSARDQVKSWAFAYAPKSMTLAELEDLTMVSVRLVNHHTRQVFDMMRGTSK